MTQPVRKCSNRRKTANNEPRFVSKTWVAECHGNALVSTPRRACLADDAVQPTFPDCPAHLSKLTKHRKRPWPGSLPTFLDKSAFIALIGPRVLKKQMIPRTVSVHDIHPVKAPMRLTSEVDASEAVPSAEGSQQHVFNNLFELSASAVLPSISWGYHRRDTDAI